MGLKTRYILIGIIGGFCLGAGSCATFPYKWYGMSGISYDGKLLGPSAELDKDFTACAPTPKEKNPCVVMFTDEFKLLQIDYGDCKNQLNDCQHGT